MTLLISVTRIMDEPGSIEFNNEKIVVKYDHKMSSIIRKLEIAMFNLRHTFLSFFCFVFAKQVFVRRARI